MAFNAAFTPPLAPRSAGSFGDVTAVTLVGHAKFPFCVPDVPTCTGTYPCERGDVRESHLLLLFLESLSVVSFPAAKRVEQ